MVIIIPPLATQRLTTIPMPSQPLWCTLRTMPTLSVMTEARLPSNSFADLST